MEGFSWVQLELIEKVEQEAGKSRVLSKTIPTSAGGRAHCRHKVLSVRSKKFSELEAGKQDLGMSLGQFRSDIFCLGRAPVLCYYKTLLLSLMGVTGVSQLLIYKWREFY